MGWSDIVMEGGHTFMPAKTEEEKAAKSRLNNRGTEEVDKVIITPGVTAVQLRRFRGSNDWTTPIKRRRLLQKK